MEARAGRGTVLFSNERLVAIDKPPGLSLQTPRARPQDAADRLVTSLTDDDRRAHLAEPGGLLLVHRLDVGTSGVVVLARDPEAHRALLLLWSERRVGKTYLALAWGHPRPGEGTYAQPLGPDTNDRRKMAVVPVGSPAVTHYRVLRAAAHVSLVELTPETGRTHQIRVHLAHAGHPIVGDDFYGGPRHHGVRDARLRSALAPPFTLLHAWRLHLPDSELGPELIVTAPLPAAFRRALDELHIEL